MQGEHFEICEPHSFLNNISSDEECIVEYKNIFARTLGDTTKVLTMCSCNCNIAAHSFADVVSAFRGRQPR